MIAQAADTASGREHLVVGLSCGHATRGVLDPVIEILIICGRARAAAYHYEDLKRLSDAELAARGLERAHLPRAAFGMLVGDCGSSTDR